MLLVKILKNLNLTQAKKFCEEGHRDTHFKIIHIVRINIPFANLERYVHYI